MSNIRIGRAARHFWEEPCISGTSGSGAIFFCGCTLRCVYCQNYSISRGKAGYNITVDELSDEMLRLQDEGANNINLVTAGSYMRSVSKAIEKAKNAGLTIPILYNTSAYESVDDIKRLEGIVDIYLPDMKYMSKDLAAKYSNAPDYPKTALAAIDEMVRQTVRGDSAFSFTDEETKTKVYNVDEYEELSDDISMVITRGTIVRHLLLPGCEEDSKAVIKEMIARYGDKIFLSVMNQYTPMEQVKEKFPELYRKYDAALYDEMLDYAIDLGLSHGFFQDGDVAEESFIPEFKRDCNS